MSTNEGMHAPLPWATKGGGIVWANDETMVIEDRSSDKDDLEFICRAVNSHYALIEALEELEIWMTAIMDCKEGIWTDPQQHAAAYKSLIEARKLLNEPQGEA